jgi:hypothetical protein
MRNPSLEQEPENTMASSLYGSACRLVPEAEQVCIKAGNEMNPGNCERLQQAVLRHAANDAGLGRAAMGPAGAMPFCQTDSNLPEQAQS